MPDYDVVIIGGGPAGLTAGINLSQKKLRTILLEKESFGGHLLNVEWIDSYPGFDKGVSGGQLASVMVNQATECGLQLEQAEALGIEIYSSSKWVNCTKGKGFTATVVILAGGFGPKKLGVPGEQLLWGKGVFTCAHCEGGLYADRVVAVCGGGDTAINDALFLAQRSAKVIVLVEAGSLSASATLKEEALHNAKLEIHYGVKVVSIQGDGSVKSIEIVMVANGQTETIQVGGVCVSIGVEPNTHYLEGLVALDKQGQIVVNEKMETDIPYILAAGEIRNGSNDQVTAIVSDGVTASITAQELLQHLH
jgi:thioredoxin reductase (NADPH)